MTKSFILAALLSVTAVSGAAFADGAQVSARAFDRAETPATGYVGAWERLQSLSGGAVPVYDAACCKVCKKGKACGDSCISRSYTCHKGQGCACDG